MRILDEAEALRRLRTSSSDRTAAIADSLFGEVLRKVEAAEISVGEMVKRGLLRLHKDGNHGSLYPRGEDFGESGVPFLSAKAITDDGAIDESEVAFLHPSKAAQLHIGWIEGGDVLLAHNASVGKVAYYDGRYAKALIGTSLTAFRADARQLNPLFLWAALRHDAFQAQLSQIMAQALRNQVPITAQRDLLLRIPSKRTQDAFAARLAEIRALQAAQAASRRRLDDLFQSLLHRAFQGEL